MGATSKAGRSLGRQKLVCDSMIFRDVNVVWSLTNIEGPDASRLNPMTRKASIWSYGKIWLVDRGCFATGGIQR